MSFNTNLVKVVRQVAFAVPSEGNEFRERERLVLTPQPPVSGIGLVPGRNILCESTNCISSNPKKKEIIKDAYFKCKMSPFNQAVLYEVFKTSGLKFDIFIDTIWELFKIDEQIWFLSARRRRGIPKRELQLIDALLERVPQRQRVFAPIARYMAWRI